MYIPQLHHPATYRTSNTQMIHLTCHVHTKWEKHFPFTSGTSSSKCLLKAASTSGEMNGLYQLTGWLIRSSSGLWMTIDRLLFGRTHFEKQLWTHSTCQSVRSPTKKKRNKNIHETNNYLVFPVILRYGVLSGLFMTYHDQLWWEILKRFDYSNHTTPSATY